MTLILSLGIIGSVMGIVDVFSIGDFGLVPQEAVFFLMFGAALWHAVWHGRPLKIPRTPEFAMAVLIWVMMAVSAIVPLMSYRPDRNIQVLKTFSHFTFVWLFGILCAVLPVTARHWVRSLQVQFVVMILVCLYGIYQIPARAGNWPGAWLEITNSSYNKVAPDGAGLQLALRFADFYRATSIFVEPSALATYCAVGLSIILIPFVRQRGQIIKNRVLISVLILLLILCMFLTFSITGLMLITTIYIALTVQYPKNMIKRSVVALAALACVVVIGDTLAQNIGGISVLDLFGKRLSGLATGKAATGETEISGESYSQRAGDYDASIRVYTESPVIGVGPGNFAYSYHGARHDALYPATSYGTIMSEMGVVGLSVFMGFLGCFLVGSWYLLSRWETGQPRDTFEDKIVALPPFFAMAALITSFNANILITAWWWYWFGFILSSMTISRRALGLLVERDLYVVRKPWKSYVRLRRPATTDISASIESTL